MNIDTDLGEDNTRDNNEMEQTKPSSNNSSAEYSDVGSVNARESSPQGQRHKRGGRKKKKNSRHNRHSNTSTDEDRGKEDKDSEKKQVRSIRLDLDLEIEIFLRAKIKGDVTITFL